MKTCYIDMKLRILGSLLALFQSFLSNRFQRVLLNDQSLSWSSVQAGVPQVSLLVSLLDIYIKDLPGNLESLVKLFSDDNFLFSTVHNLLSAGMLNDDLKKILEYTYKWQILFNPDLTKQAHEVLLKASKIDHFILI